MVTTSSPPNWSSVQRHGRSYIIDHTSPREQILEFSKANGPYDGIFDAMGSAEVTRLLGDLLRYSQIGMQFWIKEIDISVF